MNAPLALKPEATTRPLPGYSFASVAAAELDEKPYHLKGLFDVGELIFMFGDSGTMKSFAATDLLLHAVMAWDWHGHRAGRRSGGLIVLGEGQAGYKRRLKALQIHYGAVEAPIWICDEPVSLMTGRAVLEDWIAKAEEAIGLRVGIILLDTFSLMLEGGEESSNAETSQALRNARAAAAGRTLMFVHHTGHGDKDRERGAYQIRASADVRLKVSRDDEGRGRVITVENLKQKDRATAEPVRLSYRVIHLGNDSDGDPITSLVMEGTDLDPVAAKPDQRSKPLDYVRQAIRVTGSNEREIVRQQFYVLYPGNEEAKRKAFTRGWESYMREICEVDGE